MDVYRYLFCRWPPFFQKVACYRQKHWVMLTLTHFTNTQKRVRDKSHQDKETTKVGKARQRDYISQREVLRSEQLFMYQRGLRTFGWYIM